MFYTFKGIMEIQSTNSGWFGWIGTSRGRLRTNAYEISKGISVNQQCGVCQTNSKVILRPVAWILISLDQMDETCGYLYAYHPEVR